MVAIRRLAFVELGAALALAGCGLPRSGPSYAEFAKAGEADSIDLVDATADDAVRSRDSDRRAFPLSWKQAPPPKLDAIGAGDVLRVLIFEHDGLGLFAGGQDGAARLESVPVDANGDIQLPYVGRVHLAGLSPVEARDVLLRRMRRLVSSADVQVSFVERHSQLVSIQGDVTKPGALPLSPETSRLTSLLSVAASSASNPDQALVTIRRAGDSATVRLSGILDQPAEDIALQPGDMIIVRNLAEAVNVLGSAGMQGRIRLPKNNYTLIDVIADSRGLSSDAANPAAVFLMQLSDKARLASGKAKVYRFDFRNPAQLAVASSFVVHDGDVIYISTASFTQTRSVLSALSGVLNTARSATVVAQ